MKVARSARASRPEHQIQFDEGFDGSLAQEVSADFKKRYSGFASISFVCVIYFYNNSGLFYSLYIPLLIGTECCGCFYMCLLTL